MAARCRRPGSSPASAGSSGRECVVVVNDATVKGGTYYPLTVKKHLRAQDVARRTGCPASISSIPAAPTCRTRTRCSPTGTHFGRIFYNQATHVGGGHPADRGGDGLVHGRRRLRAGDVATRRSSSSKQGTIFLGGPPLVKAATGEVVTAEELGGGDVHTRISGVADHLAEDDTHALALARRDRRQPEPATSGSSSTCASRASRSTIRASCTA